MLVKDQFVKMTWHKKVRDYYIDKGYQYTKDKDTFLVKVQDLHPNSQKIIKVICDCCKKELEITYVCYSKAISKDKYFYCQECINDEKSKTALRKRQDEHYKKLINFCNKKGYTLITKKEDIINTQSEISYLCPIHGKYTTKLTSILQGKTCYKCSRQAAIYNRNKNSLKERQNNLYNKATEKCKKNGYELKSNKNDILSNRSYIEYICPNHGIHKMRIANLISGRCCPECSKEYISKLFRTTLEEVILRIEKCDGHLLNPEEYINNTAKNLKILCPQCKQPFYTSLRNFTQHGGQVCKECCNTETIGEKKIRIYLENHDITYEQEKWFSKCRDINPLPFDFYLPDKKTIIEFDGRQHFEDTEFFTYSYEKTKKHDEIKNDYCNKNNINLIRIPYWDINNIDKILNSKLNSHEDIV